MADIPVRQLRGGTDVLGESVVWDGERQCLFWVDIVGRVIRRFDPATTTEQRWDVEELPTSIDLRSDGGAVVGLTRRVALWDFGTSFETLAVPEPDLPNNRSTKARSRRTVRSGSAPCRTMSARAVRPRT